MDQLKPILFSAESIKAILEGRKSQTRRITNPQPSIRSGVGKWLKNGTIQMIGDQMAVTDYMGKHNPYGKAGDTLWARETFYQYGFWSMDGFLGPGRVKWIFKALSKEVLYFDTIAGNQILNKKETHVPGWYKRNALFMPKKAARLFLRIIDVGVEQLQQISQEDARAEGMFGSPHRPSTCEHRPHADKSIARDCFICSYRLTWNLLHGENGNGWDKNPWVWVVEFEKQ